MRANCVLRWDRETQGWERDVSGDVLNIDALIKQATAVQQKKLVFPGRPLFVKRDWQDMLDNKPYPHLRYGKL